MSLSTNAGRRLAIAAASVTIALPLAPGVAPPASAATTGSVSGVITDESGEPIAGASAELCAVVGDRPSESAGTATTDPDGRYRISDVPDGTYSVLFTDPASVEADGSRFLLPAWLGGEQARGTTCSANPAEGGTQLRVDGAAVAEVDAALSTGGRLVGSTRDTTGALVTDMQLVYDTATGSSHTVRSTGDEGAFRTLLMAPGPQQVTFHDTRSETERTIEVDLAPGVPTEVDVEFADTDLTTRGGPHIDAPDVLAEGAVLTGQANWYHPEVEESWAWFRDGEPIDGATGSTYRLSGADAGHTITAEVTGTLAGHDATTIATANRIEVREVYSSTQLTLDPATAPKESPEQIRALVQVELSDGSAPDGTVTLWDDTQSEEDGGRQQVASGTPDEDGRLVINFPTDFALTEGAVYAAYVDDEEDRVNGSSSREIAYSLH